MKNIRFVGRIILSLMSHQFLVACSDVSFAPAPGSPVVFKSGTALTDEFTQGYASKNIDILFVVDNSGSMSEEQQKLGDRIGSFISTLYDVDWQIGITTTDVSTGKYGLRGSLLPLDGADGYILTPQTPNYMEVFRRTVVREESYNCTINCPTGNEQPLRAAISAIEKRETSNKGFFRDGADLGLLVLSDEDEMSNGPSNATSPQAVINAVSDAFQDSKRLLTYGMIVVPGDRACRDSDHAHQYGDFVASLAQLTGGLTGSICDTDYAPTLGQLGDSVRHLLEYVQLRATPNPESIRITFTPQHSTTFQLLGRRIFFDAPPAKDTHIKVDYIVE